METCSNCLKPKATLTCGICQTHLCKKCAHFVEEDHFALKKTVAEELIQGRYCGPCFDEKVNPEIIKYDQLVRSAKKVLVFYTDAAQETRLFKRDSKPLVVENCADEKDTLMQMAFSAVENGYNTLVDVEVVVEKVHIDGYRTSKWSGRGLPVKLDNYKPNRKSRFIGNYYETT